MKRVERIREFEGWLERYVHDSDACHCEMTFSVYLPPQAEQGPVPTLYWLSGLTCTDDNFRVKAGAQRYAAEQGIALVIPDTSPRGDEVPDTPDRYDLGQGAGFYVNATQAPWDRHYHMFDYVNEELPRLVERELALIPGLRAISGHSMGGHGALISALKKPGAYRTVSAFAPICHPVESDWGQGCFSAYLGDDRKAWKEWDAVELIRSGARVDTLWVEQGTDDEFLHEGQLQPHELKAACEDADIDLRLEHRPLYDHSYHFIASFIGDHIAWHANALKQA